MQKGELKAFFFLGMAELWLYRKQFYLKKKMEEFYSSKGTAVMKLMNFMMLFLVEVTGRKIGGLKNKSRT